MKLCAIYNVWDDYQMCLLSIRNIEKLVDGIIVVASENSNYGEKSKIPSCWINSQDQFECVQFTPDMRFDAMGNETNKRNLGLSKARELGYTHFIMMDADEFYEPEPFLKEKKRFETSNISGLVCRSKVYFKTPYLTIGYDATLVTFIHKITPGLCFTWNKLFPFAWSSMDGVPFTPVKRIRIDPTRQLNITSGVEWSEIVMHHYSYVRDDLKKKIRNSSARRNLERSTILTDYCQATEGYFCQFYGKVLEPSSNLFNLPELVDENVCKEIHTD